MNNRLKVLRAEHNWSQAELALRLDVSRQAVKTRSRPASTIPRCRWPSASPVVFQMPIEEIFNDGQE